MEKLWKMPNKRRHDKIIDNYLENAEQDYSPVSTERANSLKLKGDTTKKTPPFSFIATTQINW